MTSPMDPKRLAAMEEACEIIGRMVAAGLPPNVGFCLILHEYGPGGWSTYMSNISREDNIKAMRELADVLEAHKDVPKGVLSGRKQ